MSKPEVWLWQRLRRRQIGFLFHRQRSLGPYHADFYCHEARLVVETDGYCHLRRVEDDRERDAWMTARGIAALRVPAREVFEDLDTVVTRIRRECARLAAICAEKKAAARGAVDASPGLEDSATPSAGAEGDACEVAP